LGAVINSLLPFPLLLLQYGHGHFIFNDTATRDLLYGLFNVPKNYVGTASVIIVWTTTAITGNVVWDFDYRTVAGDDANSLDQAGNESVRNAEVPFVLDTVAPSAPSGVIAQ